MSETSTETTETVAEDTTTPTETSEVQAEQPKPTETVDFWKTKARDQEKRAKANADAAKELEALKAASMTEAEKAEQARIAAEQRANDLAGKYTSLLKTQAITA